MNIFQLKSFLIFSLVLAIASYSLFYSGDQMSKLNSHYKNFEYEEVIILAEQILDSPKLSIQEKSEILKIKGISEYSSNRMLSAKITFAELILFNKNAQLDMQKVSPKIVAFFNELKSELIANNI
jgi:hypothetical protein